jgi:quercetin dioxygenase-like cupin family protein
MTHTNIFEGLAYKVDEVAKRKVVDTKELLMMQVALSPGQSVPRHEANSHVHLLVVHGEITCLLGEDIFTGKEGDIIPVAHKTKMEISNKGEIPASFLILKTPNPSELK